LCLVLDRGGRRGDGVRLAPVDEAARRFSLRRELALGVLVYGLYLLVGRVVLAANGRVRARRNAERVAALERRLGVQIEPAVQRALLRFPRLTYALNVGYGLFNVTLTVGWLVLLYRRRDPGYHALRRACAIAYLGAQPVFLLLPTAPPRVLDGFVDTLADVSGIDLEHPFLLRFYNPVAAVPSLHVAFAVVTANAIADRSESRLGRGAARAYPWAVSLAVIGTGNHYVADVATGALLGTAARRL
jgi:PAP2 superfamily